MMFHNQARGNTKVFYMKLLTKDSSKRSNCDIQKDIEDISNVIKDTDSIAAINNCVNNFGAGIANRVINSLFL